MITRSIIDITHEDIEVLKMRLCILPHPQDQPVMSCLYRRRKNIVDREMLRIIFWQYLMYLLRKIVSKGFIPTAGILQM